jgi:hypothetical protein
VGIEVVSCDLLSMFRGEQKRGEPTMSKKMGMDRQAPTPHGVAAEIETLPGTSERRLNILYVPTE